MGNRRGVAVERLHADYGQGDSHGFELTGPGQFKFKTLIAPQYPDNESGEAARMDMLQGWLTNNNLCGAGYEITSRQGVKRTPFVTDMYYYGKCKGVV